MTKEELQVGQNIVLVRHIYYGNNSAIPVNSCAKILRVTDISFNVRWYNFVLNDGATEQPCRINCVESFVVIPDKETLAIYLLGN